MCAPGEIRTPNNRFEACRDIHFTTGADVSAGEKFSRYARSGVARHHRSKKLCDAQIRGASFYNNTRKIEKRQTLS